MNTNSREWMQITEAREWIARHRQRAALRGHQEARQWWLETIADIEKKRGKAGADNLKRLMNEERLNATRSQN